MSRDPSMTEIDAFSQEGVRTYLFVGLGSLLLAWLFLMERVAFGGLAVIVLAIGSLGLVPYLIPPRWRKLTRWVRHPSPALPILVIFSIAVIETLFGEIPFRTRLESIPLDDVLILALLLTYAAAQYRLYSMGQQWIPVDSRPHPRRLQGDPPETRPGEVLREHELRDLGFTLVLSLLLGIGVWSIVSIEPIFPATLRSDELSISGTWRRTVLTLWLLGIGIVVARQLLFLFRLYSLNRDEANMILRDALWAETRSEQRRHGRWLAWLGKQREIHETPEQEQRG